MIHEIETNPLPGNQTLKEYAKRYCVDNGLPPPQRTPYQKADPLARQIAEYYDSVASTPDDPDVQAAYAALIQEVQAQFEMLPLEIIWVGDGEYSYKNSEDMMRDVEQGRLEVYTGGGDHPLMTRDENNIFRAVHDSVHAIIGASFGPIGEFNSFLEHSKMFTPLARIALTCETRCQNAFVVAGPYADLPPAERPYALQKVFMPPLEWTTAPVLVKAYAKWPEFYPEYEMANNPPQYKDKIVINLTVAQRHLLQRVLPIEKPKDERYGTYITDGDSLVFDREFAKGIVNSITTLVWTTAEWNVIQDTVIRLDEIAEGRDDGDADASAVEKDEFEHAVTLPLTDNEYGLVARAQHSSWSPFRFNHAAAEDQSDFIKHDDGSVTVNLSQDEIDILSMASILGYIDKKEKTFTTHAGNIPSVVADLVQFAKADPLVKNDAIALRDRLQKIYSAVAQRFRIVLEENEASLMQSVAPGNMDGSHEMVFNGDDFERFVKLLREQESHHPEYGTIPQDIIDKMTAAMHENGDQSFSMTFLPERAAVMIDDIRAALPQYLKDWPSVNRKSVRELILKLRDVAYDETRDDRYSVQTDEDVPVHVVSKRVPSTGEWEYGYVSGGGDMGSPPAPVASRRAPTRADWEGGYKVALPPDETGGKWPPGRKIKIPLSMGEAGMLADFGYMTVRDKWVLKDAPGKVSFSTGSGVLEIISDELQVMLDRLDDLRLQARYSNEVSSVIAKIMAGPPSKIKPRERRADRGSWDSSYMPGDEDDDA